MQCMSESYTAKVNADKLKKNTIIVNQTFSICELHKHSKFNDDDVKTQNTFFQKNRTKLILALLKASISL